MANLRFAAALLAAPLVFAHANAAKAQIINPFGVNNGAFLTSSDYKVAAVAVGKLLNETPATVGKYEDWSNPATGNSGKLTILEIFTRNGMDCRQVNLHTDYAKKGAAPVDYKLDTCHTSAGWKVVEKN